MAIYPIFGLCGESALFHDGFPPRCPKAHVAGAHSQFGGSDIAGISSELVRGAHGFVGPLEVYSEPKMVPSSLFWYKRVLLRDFVNSRS